jgi:hypothetical protein
MTKGYYPRHDAVLPNAPQNGLLGLFVTCGLVVFPATVLLVTATQFALQHPKVVLQLIGFN